MIHKKTVVQNIRIIAAGFCLLTLSGCATTSAPNELDDLRRQMNVMEGRVQEKDRQIEQLQENINKVKADSREIGELQSQLEARNKELTSLQEALDRESKEKALLAERIDVLMGQYKRPESTNYTRQIQLALKNAGFDPGAIDGVMGSRTRKAIRYFQKANNLPITGKIDKNTWARLRKYLHVK